MSAAAAIRKLPHTILRTNPQPPNPESLQVWRGLLRINRKVPVDVSPEIRPSLNLNPAPNPEPNPKLNPLLCQLECATLPWTLPQEA